MKIEKDQSVLFHIQRSSKERANEKQKNGKTISGVNLKLQNSLQDQIESKRQYAKKEAMKLVKGVFDNDRKIDQDMEDRYQNMKTLQKEIGELKEELQSANDRRDMLQDSYEKGETTKEDYLKELSNLREEEKSVLKQIGDYESEIQSENAIIKGTKLERLKNSPMQKAEKQADAIEESASNEIQSMIFEDAKNTIEEERKERDEQAKKLKEEKEEKQKFIEKQKEKNNLFDEVEAYDMVSLQNAEEDVKKEVDYMIQKMKLLAEDIKGAAVDENV